MLVAFTESDFCQYRSWNTSVCTVHRLRAGQRRNHVSIPGTTKELSPHSHSPERFWRTPSFLCHGNWEAPAPGGKRPWREKDQSSNLLPRMRKNGVLILLSHMTALQQMCCIYYTHCYICSN